MIKQIFKQIWTERRHNVWLLVELMVVFFFLLVMCDFMWIRLKNYMEPKGFDITDTYVLQLKKLDPAAPNYVKPEDITLTETETLSALLERVRLYPDIEHLSYSLYASPYSMGGFWTGLKADTVLSPSVRRWAVSPSYFDVFRIRSADGTPIRIETIGQKQIILTKDMADILFGDYRNAPGKNVYWPDDDVATANPGQVTHVTTLMKRQEFQNYQGAFFEIFPITRFKENEPNLNLANLDICVRVKPGSARHFEENFMAEMGERLREDNMYVSSVIPSEKFRNDIVGKIIREDVSLMAYVMGFVLITVFMGVFGVFWLRTRQRRSEIGIRMAMGADKAAIRRGTVTESLCLMALSILPGFVVYLNLLQADVMDTTRLPFTPERVLVAFSATLFISTLIIVGGTSWPANRAASIQPVDALRDE